MKHQLKLNKATKTSSPKDRKSNLNNTANKVGQPTIDSWFNKTDSQTDSFTTNIKTESFPNNFSTQCLQSEIPLVCLDDSEENFSDKENSPVSFNKQPKVSNSVSTPITSLNSPKKRGLLSSLKSFESENDSSLCFSVQDDKDSSDSDFEPDPLWNFKKAKSDKKHTSVNILTNSLLNSSLSNSAFEKDISVDRKASNSDFLIENKGSSPIICLADSPIKVSQNHLKTNENTDGKIKTELLSLKKKAGLLSSKSKSKLSTPIINSISSQTQNDYPFLETRDNDFRQVTNKEKISRSPSKQFDRTSSILEQEKPSYCEPTNEPIPIIQSPSETNELDTPLVDKDVLDLFKQQFMGGKPTRKKRIFSDCQEEEILVVDLDRTEVLTIPTTLKKQPVPRKQSGTKKRTYKPRASKQSNVTPTEVNSGNSRRPSLKELYNRSKINGRYNKQMYSDLKKQHGYNETTRSRAGNRRKAFKKKKKT